MANIVGDIAIKIGADLTPLVTDMARAKAEVRDFGASAGSAAGGGMRAFGLAGTAMAGAAAAAGLGLVALTRASMENIDAVSKAAGKLGIHTASLQAMTQVADEAGISMEQLTGAMTKMLKGVDDLRQGTVAQVEAFDRLGLKLSDLNGLGADEMFAKIAERIDALQDPVAQTAAAMDIFGRSGADLLPMMQGYANALQSATDYQRKFGIAMSDEMGHKIEAANDAIGRMTGAARGLGNVLAGVLSPILEETADKVTSLLQALVDLIDYSDAEINQMALDKSITEMRDSLGGLAGQATQTALALEAIGDKNAADTMWAQVKAINAANEAYDNGQITLDRYKTLIEDTADRIQNLAAIYQAFDGLDLQNAIAQMTDFRHSIALAFDAAALLAAKLPGAKPAAGSGGLNITGSASAGTGAGGGASGSAVVLSGGGGGGGGGGGASQAALQAQLKAMQDAFASEAELEDRHYADQLAKIEEFRQAKLAVGADYDQLEQQAEAAHLQKIADIQDAEFQARMSAYSGALSDLGALMQTKNKELFEIGKAASIASAVVDGYQSAVAAWKSGMELGGPWLAAAFTAASLAKTGALISQIASTHIGTTGQSNAGGSGVPASGAAGAGAKVANVTLVGDTFSRSSVEDLFAQINAGLQQGYRVNITG